MRPIPLGYHAGFETTVTSEMLVDFEELGAVHPVYATYWLAKHMELVGRKIILPFLEEGEEGIGYAVSVRHLAPALAGMRVRVEGEHVGTEGNRVTVRLRAEHELGDLIGEGETVQVILPAWKIRERFEQLERRRQERRSLQEGREAWPR